MDFISHLPIEILEEIFLYLDIDDLMRCSHVSYKWREVMNSNKIWAAQCSKERILRKDYLQTSWSLISNPVKVFKEHVADPETTRLTAPCHWRSHYNQYKFLERNWRKGNYSMIRSKIKAEYYIDGLLISSDQNGLAAYNIQDLNSPMCIQKEDPSSSVDAVRVKDGLLFYTQGRRLICMKKHNQGFVKQYHILWPANMKQHSNHRTGTEPILSFKITDHFMVVQDMTNACFLYFYDYKTGELLRRTKMHQFTGRACARFTALEAFGNNVFVAYSHLKHWIIIYDFKADKAGITVKTALQSSELVVSRNFFSSKLTENQTEKSCELHVWSVHTGDKVGIFCTDRTLPVFLTPDDRLIYSDHYTVYVRGFIDSSSDVDLSVEPHLQGMKSVWGNLLVLNLGFSVQLWDVSTKQKLHTYLRDNIDDMWVDDRHIVLSLSNRPWLTNPGYVIGFW